MPSRLYIYLRVKYSRLDKVQPILQFQLAIISLLKLLITLMFKKTSQSLNHKAMVHNSSAFTNAVHGPHWIADINGAYAQFAGANRPNGAAAG